MPPNTHKTYTYLHECAKGDDIKKIQEDIHRIKQNNEHQNRHITKIENSLIDIKTFMGIKNMTNGQIKERMDIIGEKAEKEDKELERWLIHHEKRLQNAEKTNNYNKILVALNGLFIMIILGIFAYIKFG